MNKLAKHSVLLGTCFILVFSIAGCSLKSKEKTKSVPTLVSPVIEELKTQEVKKGSIERVNSKWGYVSPAKKVDMCFKFKGGYLSKLEVKAGDMVKAGQVLAELDTTDTKYAIKQEEIKLKQAQLSYDQAASSGATDIQKQILQLNVDSEKLKMNQLQEDLKNSVLVADIPGKVINVTDVKISQFISGYQPIVTIADPKELQVQCDGNLQDFAIGAKAIIKTTNAEYKGEVVTNTLQQNGSTQNNSSQNNKVIVKFLEEAKNLTIGDSVRVICTLESKDNTIVIPYKAVKFGENNHAYVRIKQNEDIIERYIEMGIQTEDTVEVSSGLSEGEIIVIN